MSVPSDIFPALLLKASGEWHDSSGSRGHFTAHTNNAPPEISINRATMQDPIDIVTSVVLTVMKLRCCRTVVWQNQLIPTCHLSFPVNVYTFESNCIFCLHLPVGYHDNRRHTNHLIPPKERLSAIKWINMCVYRMSNQAK